MVGQCLMFVQHPLHCRPVDALVIHMFIMSVVVFKSIHKDLESLYFQTLYHLSQMSELFMCCFLIWLSIHLSEVQLLFGGQ